jgi:hypothetical protein
MRLRLTTKKANLWSSRRYHSKDRSTRPGQRDLFHHMHQLVKIIKRESESEKACRARALLLLRRYGKQVAHFPNVYNAE